MIFGRRLFLLRKAMTETDLDVFIVMDRANTFYLTGFQGTYSLLMVTEDHALFLTDSRYYECARNSLPSEYEIVLQMHDGKNQLKSFFTIHGKLRVGFEPQISYEKFRWLGDAVRPARLVETKDIIDPLRRTKDEDELRCIRRAAALGDRCFQRICHEIKPGICERELALQIRRFFEDAGAEGESFPAIVAFGPNAALPHHQTSRRKLKKGDVVLIDMGCRIKGYCSDMTRTLFLDTAREKEREIYRIVLEAQTKGLEAVKPGLPAREVDEVVRQHIIGEGYGDAFGHNTGHGVGIEIHESPVLGPQSADLLQEGMIITIEPGIYCPRFSGVRIEDLVLVTKEGAQCLSKSSKQMRIL